MAEVLSLTVKVVKSNSSEGCSESAVAGTSHHLWRESSSKSKELEMVSTRYRTKIRNRS